MNQSGEGRMLVNTPKVIIAPHYGVAYLV